MAEAIYLQINGEMTGETQVARTESMLTAFEEYLRVSLSNSLHQSCLTR